MTNHDRRAEDHKPMRRALNFVQRWQPIFWIGTLIAVAFGFQVRTPAAQIQGLREDLRLHADSANMRMITHEYAIGRLDSIARSDRLLLEGMARGWCVTTPERDWLLLGLPCERLLRGR